MNNNNPKDLEAPFEGLIEGLNDQIFEDAIHIKAIDFKLDQSKLAQINRGLNELYQLAPINSQIHLEYKAVSDMYTAKLEVLSATKEFRTTSNGANLETLYFEMEKSILSEISEWKRNRFKNI